MPKRTPSPQETKIINTHVAAILDELNAAGIYSNAVLAFVALNDWDYHLATMIGRELECPVDEAIDALIRYAHDELCQMIVGVEHRAAEITAGRGSDLPSGSQKKDIVMEGAVTESMGWRQRLESVRKIPHDRAGTISISVKMLEDVKTALDHIAKLEAGISECESDGGCRAAKVVKQEEERRPLTN